MVKVGDVAVKVVGRDAGQLCAIVEILDDNYVLIDGLTRRRKCNLNHLEFLGETVKIKKNADCDAVKSALRDAGFEFKDVKKGKARAKKEKPKRIKKAKVEAAEPKKKSTKK
jgi:large subunit ribosomal protein L14e